MSAHVRTFTLHRTVTARSGQGRRTQSQRSSRLAHAQMRHSSILAKSIILPAGSPVNESSIISLLPSWRHQSNAQVQETAQVIFLLTPKLASFLGPNSSFLENAILGIFKQNAATAKLPGSVSSLAAIVDRIPGRWRDDEESLEPCEGVSVLLGGLDVQHDISTSPARNPFSEESVPAKLQITTSSGTRKSFSSGSESTSTTTYTIPVANTLFVNGHLSTIMQTRWKLTPSTSSTQQISLSHITTESAQSPKVILPPNTKWTSTSYVPLQPLTLPRRITSAMGNILRAIEIDGRPSPASTELEASVSKSVKTRSTKSRDGGRVKVYALITSRGFPSHSSLDTPEIVFPTAFLNAIRLGAQLYQVVGGGGGWGGKKGLLALDPAGMQDLVNDTNVRKPPWEVDTDDADFTSSMFDQTDIDSQTAHEGTGLNASRGALREGDSVTFFQLSLNVGPVEVSQVVDSEQRRNEDGAKSSDTVNDNDNGRDYITSNSNQPETPSSHQTFILGVIPQSESVPSVTHDTSNAYIPASSKDTPSTSSSKDSPEPPPPSISTPTPLPRAIEIDGLFGALSEAPVNISISTSAGTSGSTLEADVASQQAKSTATARATARVSVPYSHFEMRCED